MHSGGLGAETAAPASRPFSTARYLPLCVAALGVMLSGIATYAIARQLTLNSDEVQSFLAAQSILHGHVLLAGWHLSVDNFFFDDTIPFVIMEGVFGSRIAEIPVFAAILHMAVVTVALIACMRQRGPRRRRLIPLAVIMLLLGAPPAGITLPMLLPGLHGTGLVLSLLALLCLARMARPGGLRRRYVACFLLAACPAIASDPFTLIYAFGPALLVLFWACLAAPAPPRPAVLTGLVLAATAIGMATPRVIGVAGGFHLEPTLTFGFVRPEQLAHNAAGLVFGFLDGAGANVFGRDIENIATLTSGARFAGWVCGGMAVIVSWRIPRQAFPVTLDRLLLAGCAVLAGACLTSRMFGSAMDGTPMIGTQESTRHLTPLIVFGAILAARAMGGALAALPTRRSRAAGMVALAACSAGLLAGHEAMAIRLFRSPSWISSNPQTSLGQYLLSRRLTCGVANFWDSNIVTALSDGRVTIRAVAGPPLGPLKPFLWLSDEAWYARLDHPQFAVWRTGMQDWLHVTGETVRATYGEPKGVEQVGLYSIATFAGATCGTPGGRNG